ncbi:glycosyltransferase [Flavobacterium weaverense]|uniref:Glycosyltransferase involved in cell wall biosynthesis n=1 Tax=Flavobacterium weaverense TaxID=271156 RepID=A0A3L9ZU63_9FLAO|nr:glycosyltransferase [Flavobacterium weaverense]RMA74839.1 glycosyltransferase involved in cell wall biosynthesis [Flavobacterium weaverense]
MKVLHVINSLNTGGAEKLLLDTIPLFNQKGVEVDLLVIDGTEYPYLNKIIEKKSCKVLTLNSKNIYSPTNIFRIIPYLRQYDIIHVHLFPAQYWVAMAKIISFSNVKLVFTEHSTSNRRIKSFFLKFIDRLIYSSYDKVVCITQEVRDVLRVHTKLECDKFVIIENGVDLQLIYDTSMFNRSDLNTIIEKGDVLIIQVAGFRIEKDQKTVIKSLKYLPSNVKALFVGDGIFKDECEKFANALGLQSRICFLGIRTDVPALLKMADVAVLSSHWEGMPLSVIEAMAANKPVVASNVPGVFQLVEGYGLLFEKGNERDLAKAINELLNDEKFYNKVSESGFQHAKQYDINVMVNRQIELYNDLM